MNRAPIVIGSTAVGLGLILTFHTHSPTAARAAASSTATTTPATTTPGNSTGVGTSPTTAPAVSTTDKPEVARSASGQDVSYQYGDIQLKVTETGSRITSIDVLRNDADDPRSAEINSQAVPTLTSQALSAQSAQIDGVSGASFTSQAYAQALQSAIDQLQG